MIKEKESNIKMLFVVCSVLTILTILVYFVKFNNGLSNNSSDWSNFGSFVSGITTLVFPTLNVWVFIVLTISIQKAQEKTRNTEMFEIKRKNYMEDANRVFNAFDNALADAYIQKRNPDGSSLDVSRIELAFIKTYDLAEISYSDEMLENRIVSIVQQLKDLKRIYESNSYISDSMIKKRVEAIKEVILSERTSLRLSIFQRLEDWESANGLDH